MSVYFTNHLSPFYFKMIRVILFEDNKNLRESIALSLSNVSDVWFAGAFPDARDAVNIVKKTKPDIVLMDIEMPHITGIKALHDIKAIFPDVKVLIQTVFEDEDRIFQAICGGADGYMIKVGDIDKYLLAIKEVHEGGSHLSPRIAAKVMTLFQHAMVKTQHTFVDLTKREKDILGCLVKGLSYKMIADYCSVSYSTVNSHIKNIYEKLHVNSAPEAIVKAIEMRLI
jgi:DNA-binding NarL/FixJ family response regulator